MTDPGTEDQVRSLTWELATVEAIKAETYRVKTFTLRPARWRRFRPGQHVDVRLTAADGYQAQRSYSIASAPEAVGTFDLGVELVEGGEVSPFFHQVVRVGDQIEVRGPIGGPFTWTTRDGGPVLFIAGGSGIVPIMSMLRHRRAMPSPGQPEGKGKGRAITSGRQGTDGGRERTPPALLLYSSRAAEDIIYRNELAQLAASDASFFLFHTLTRIQPAGWTGYSRRIDRDIVVECVSKLGRPELVFICGPTGFVEAAADAAISAGLVASNIRTERFGPSGSAPT